MTKTLLSRRRADKVALAIFLLGLALLSYRETWWPELILVFGAAFFAKKILTSRYYEALLAVVIFGGGYATIAYSLGWMPVLFVVAAIVVLFQAFINTPEDEIEEEDELEKEIEEDRE